MFTGKIIDGRPRFKNVIPEKNSEQNSPRINFISKNSLVSENAPASYSLFKKIADWFCFKFKGLFSFTIQRPDLYKEKNLWFSSAKVPSDLKLTDLIQHYRNFIASEKESTHELKKCLSQFENDLQVRLDLQSQFQNASRMPRGSKKLVAEQKAASAKKEFISKKLEDVKTLKEGETRLFDLEGVACLWSKQQGKYRFELIGPYSRMKAFQPKSLLLGGKVKIERSIAFENIPADVLFTKTGDPSVSKLESWLTQWSDSKLSSQNQATWLGDLAQFRRDSTALSQFKTQDDRTDKVYWNVIAAIHQVKSPPKLEKQFKDQQKSIQLRAQLAGLFDFFKNERYALSINHESFFKHEIYDDLKVMHKNVATNCLRAFRKGQLSTEEFEEIRVQLDYMAEALAKANPTLPAFNLKQALTKPEIPTAKVDMLGAKPLVLLGNAQPDALKQALESREISPPVLTPLASVEFSVPTASPYAEINRKEDFLKILRQNLALPDQKEKEEQLLQFFYAVPFAPFSGLNVQDPTSLWWSFSAAEQKEVMEAIHHYAVSKFGMSEKNKNMHKELSQLQHETLLKMTYMVLFIESQTLKVKLDYIDTYSQLGEYLGSKGVDLIERHVIYRYDSKREAIEHTYRKVSGSSSVIAKELINVAGSIDAQNLKWAQDAPTVENSFSQKLFLILHNTVSEKKKTRILASHHKDLGGYIPDGSAERLSPKWLPGETKNWMRPINNPFLAALYRNASTHIAHDELSNDNYGNPILTPESFQTQPQAIFNEIKRVFEQLQGEKSGENTEIENIPFTEQEQQCLLRLLRLENPQIELLNFMKEFPHLFKYSSVRNYFDNLFFNTSLHRFLKESHSKESYSKELDPTFIEIEIPQQIQEMIERLERQVEEGRQNPEANAELLSQRFDALLYFYEMKEKLRQVYESHHAESYSKPSVGDPISTRGLQPSLEATERLFQLSLTDKRLSSSTASAAQLHLMTQLAGKEIPGAAIHPLIFEYMCAFAAPQQAANSDPAVEETLKIKWKGIVKALKEHQNALSMDSLKLTLDYLCFLKGLAPAKEAWKAVAGAPLTFSTENYRVDLETLTVSIVSQEKAAEVHLLPEKILKNPAFLAQFPHLAHKKLPAKSQVVNGETVYTFYSEGKPQHIALGHSEEGAVALRFYKEIVIDGHSKLVQFLSPSKLKDLSNAVLQEFSKKFNDSHFFPAKIWRGIEFFKKSLTLSEQLLPPLFFQDFYLDPSNPSHGYKLSANNEILFEVVFKETRKGLAIDYVVDRRINSKEHWQVNTGKDLEGLEAFNKIENAEQLIVWSQKGEIRKVELQRYGLSFAWDQGEWKCLNTSLKGYKLEPLATAKDKQGLEHSLLLRHPDPLKPLKLVVPESKTIVVEGKELKPVASSWFGTLLLAIETARTLASGHVERPLIKAHPAFENNSREINHDILDLRPFTHEICFQEKNHVKELLNLADHALKTGQPALAWQNIQKIDFKTFSKDPKTLKLLSTFIQKKEGDKPSEAALKFKMCCKIYDALANQQHSKKSLRKNLRKFMLAHGKVILAGGRKIPPQLQLAQSELVQLAVIAKKLDPEFYVQHLQAHLLAKHAVITDQVNEERFAQVKKERHVFKAEQTFEKRIETLETHLNANTLTDAELSAPIPRTAGVPLLFNPKDVESLFKRIQPELPKLKLQIQKKANTASKNALNTFQKDIDDYSKKELERPLFEIKADALVLKKFADTKLKPKLLAYATQAEEVKHEIDAYMQKSKSADEQLAIYSGEKVTASLDVLREGLAANSLKALQEAGAIPASVDLAKLQQMLTHYFEVLSRRHAAAACIKAISDLEHSESRNNPVLWKSISMSLYRMLTVQRFYDPAKDPRPLVFEAQQFINFKCLDGGLDQLDLLDTLMSNPTRAIQAPTGAGKTSVISTMRSLLKANGKNLVVQKVTAPLYDQTYDKLKEVLGGLYGRVVYPLKFSLNMPMIEVVTQKIKDQKTGEMKEVSVERSIFRKMYGELLDVIQSKGCVLTDYKSLPLIEEKFWKLAQEMLEMQQNGQTINALQTEHFTYLKKILNLLSERSDENMDEYDLPNRPINKTQIDLGMGSHPIPPFLKTISLEIYQHLLEDRTLLLRQNVQGDLTEEMRLGCIERCAEQMASKMSQAKGLNKEKLLAYFLGKNEEIAVELQNSQDSDLLDRMAVCKDQFSTYLPLTLRGKRKGKYDRSDDGERTIPCVNGVKHEAKSGTILEEINYTIQDYLQGGITAHDYTAWSQNLKRELEEQVGDSPRKQILQAELQRILPGCSLADLGNPRVVDQHIQEINQDVSKIAEFLETKLGKLKTSGAVISMGPQDIVNMSRTASGMSATSGAPEALHNHFKVDLEQKGAIRANMALRVVQRAESHEIVYYDPQNPMDVIKAVQKEGPLAAIIDGAGLFNENPEAAVKQLLDSPKIKYVGHHKNGSLVYQGEPTAKVENSGFLFTQDQTRGTDIPLAPDARALLTIPGNDSIGDFFQKEGRLRIDTQRFVLAIPKYQKRTKYLQQAMSKAICVDADQDGKDIYRKCKQEQLGLIRQEMRKKLLTTIDVEDFLNLFKRPGASKLFITPPAIHYSKAGDYFQAHRNVRLENCTPEIELEALRQKNAKLAEDLDLAEAKHSINQIQYSPELIAKMPEQVSSENAEELEMECEVEVEVEQEVQVEQQLEIEVEAEIEKELEKVVGAGQLINFPLRTDKIQEHALVAQTKIPYDSRIHFTDQFLPLSRDKSSPLKRHLWDGNMFRIGELKFYFKSGYSSRGQPISTLAKVVIEDPIAKDSLSDSYGWGKDKVKFDVRAGKITQKDKSTDPAVLASEEVVTVIAQIKFMDGMLNGYSAEEIKCLKKWVEASGKAQMRKHLMDTVLRYRADDHKSFEGSQLQLEIFA